MTLQVKRALAAKSRRYRLGNFRPLGGRPRPPPSSPKADMAEASSTSRSLTDLRGFLEERLSRQRGGGGGGAGRGSMNEKQSARAAARRDRRRRERSRSR